MKEKRIPVFIAIMLMILAIAGAAGWLVAKRFIPTKEPADLGQVLGVRGEETAVFLNGELQEVKGITSLWSGLMRILTKSFTGTIRNSFWSMRFRTALCMLTGKPSEVWGRLLCFSRGTKFIFQLASSTIIRQLIRSAIQVKNTRGSIWIPGGSLMKSARQLNDRQ